MQALALFYILVSNLFVTYHLLGYTSEDCSVPSKTPPQLISVQNDGECDTRKFLCKHVQVVGEGFHNARDLRCSLAEITVTA